MIVEHSLIGYLSPKSLANYNEVSFNRAIDPIMFPVSWVVTDMLEVICACLSYLFAKLSKDMSCKVMKNTAAKRHRAIL